MRSNWLDISQVCFKDLVFGQRKIFTFGKMKIIDGQLSRCHFKISTVILVR